MKEQEQEPSTEWSAPKNRILLMRMQSRFNKIPFEAARGELETTIQNSDLKRGSELVWDETGSAHKTATKAYWLFAALYHWSIEPRDGYFEVTESVYIRRMWILPLITLSIGLSLALAGLVPTVLPFQLRTVAIDAGRYMTILGFFLVLLPTLVVKSVLPKTSYAETVEDPIPGITLVAIANAIVFSVGVAGYLVDIYWVSVVAASIHVFLALLAWFWLNEINSSTVSLEVRRFLPAPSAEYVLLSFGALLPVGAIATAPLLGASQSFAVLFMAVPAGILYTIGVVYLIFSQGSVSLKLFRLSEERYESNSWIRLSFLAVSVSFSYIGVVAAVWLVQLALAGSFSQLSLVTAVVILLPLTYFWFGILIQPASLLLELRSIRQNTRSAQFPGTETVDPEVEVASNGIGPLAYPTGFNNRIVVPEQAVEMLDRGEIEAVLAHEEAHAKIYSDTFFSFIGPLIGAVLLTGQNVIYSFLNFREREFRADRYAAEQAGAENLVNALQTFETASLDHDLDNGEPRPVFTSFTPFVPAQEQVTGFITKGFSTFFGGFALSKAHPSINDRIDQLDSEEQ